MHANKTKTIAIDTDTLNPGADLRELAAAIDAEFQGVTVEIRSTGRGTELAGFDEDDADETRDFLRVVIERAGF